MMANGQDISIDNVDLFAPLETFIKGESYSDSDILRVIASAMEAAPHIASAMLKHWADICEEFGGDEVTYTDVICHIYWRTYFSPEHAGKYGTDQMVHHPEVLRNFAAYLIDPKSTEPINVRTATSSSFLQRH